MGCTRIETACGAYLQSVNGIGDKTLRYLYEEFGGLAQIRESTGKRCQDIMGKRVYTIWKGVRENSPEEYLARLEARGIRYIHQEDKLFPRKLREIPDSPFGIYVLGQLPDPNRPCVAMVGARAHSLYGQAIATKFANAFASAGILTISGMARGIDSISHRETIKAGGETFAILGSGVDVCYPPELGDLYKDIKVHGGIISTYSPGMAPLSRNFPARNRIISGLCDALLVIEAKEKSGTLITVDMALEQGKDVYAVPGKITDALSIGCNQLIAQGAGVAMDVEQMIEEVLAISHMEGKKEVLLEDWCQDEKLALDLLRENSIGMEQWYRCYKERKGEKSFAQFLSFVTELEMNFVIFEKEGLYTLK